MLPTFCRCCHGVRIWGVGRHAALGFIADLRCSYQNAMGVFPLVPDLRVREPPRMPRNVWLREFSRCDGRGIHCGPPDESFGGYECLIPTSRFVPFAEIGKSPRGGSVWFFRHLHSPSRMVAIGRFYGAAKFAFMMLRADLMKSSQTRPKGNE